MSQRAKLAAESATTPGKVVKKTRVAEATPETSKPTIGEDGKGNDLRRSLFESRPSTQ